MPVCNTKDLEAEANPEPCSHRKPCAAQTAQTLTKHLSRTLSASLATAKAKSSKSEEVGRLTAWLHQRKSPRSMFHVSTVSTTAHCFESVLRHGNGARRLRYNLPSLASRAA
eukprot:2000117-Amphidinium_carterae.1